MYPRNYGSMVYVGSCRIYVINKSTDAYQRPSMELAEKPKTFRALREDL